MIPGLNIIGDFYEKMYTPIINWLGSTFFEATEPIENKPTGSGDTLYQWLYYLSAILLTVVLGTLFNILDWKRKHYARLKTWFLLFLSYYVAYSMFTYGIIKLFNLQFSPPGLSRLFETYGQSSPMRLMWTFMGASSTYVVFAGACETIAGLLLLFRRTRTIGALAAFGVMFNVFMMNMSYDVPVKLFSFQLVVISAYIFAQNWRRMYTFFFTDRAMPSPQRTLLTDSKKGMWVVLGFQVIFAGLCLIGMSLSGYHGRKNYGVEREKPPLYGAYYVETFVQNGDTLPPLLTDTVRWHRVFFDYPQFTQIALMDDGATGYGSAVDTTKQEIYFTKRGEGEVADTLRYIHDEKGLILTGVLGSDTLEARLELYDLEAFGLLNRGFHWVNEVPYNRYNRK